jgi:hypothetical protein
VILLRIKGIIGRRGIIEKSSTISFINRFLIPFMKIPRILTAKTRVLPYFIIIGSHRCGTSSLYQYIRKHPCVIPAFQKEVHFFDINFKKGVDWYRAHFSSFSNKTFNTQICKHGFVTGEASPYYICHPHAPKRILETIPNVKLIALLRNPVDRAYSHYQQNFRNGLEVLTLEDAIKRDEIRIQRELKKMLENESYFSKIHRHFGYLSRGVYIDQLKVWMSLFPKEQILIIKSEDLCEDTSHTFKQVLQFLGLPIYDLKEYRKYSSKKYPKMDEITRNRLIEYFEPHNQRLSKYLGVNFKWNS